MECKQCHDILDILSEALYAIEYAAESRSYEASYESDDETRREMECNVDDWEQLSERIKELLKQCKR